MELNEKIILNQFIAKIGVIYDNKNQVYKTSKGENISNINAYIQASFKKLFGRNIKNQEQVYIEQWLYVPYDFENISYKAYLKQIVEFQDPKKIRHLKDNYDYYLESIQHKAKSKQCIYISGASGSGKTTYAKILASKYFDENEIFISSGGSHPFDEYYGEKCIIIDDFRDSVLCYNDLLRLLDNNTTSNVGARYHNKSLSRCELIILTSVKSPIELYRGIDEERFQLYRRISYFRVESNILSLMEYDKNNDYYKEIQTKSVLNEFNEYYINNQNQNIVNINDLFTNEEPIELDNKIVESIFN